MCLAACVSAASGQGHHQGRSRGVCEAVMSICLDEFALNVGAASVLGAAAVGRTSFSLGVLAS